MLRRTAFTNDAPRLRVPVACCLAAVVALSLGPSGEAAVRSAVRDLARPGFAVVRWSESRSREWDFGRWPWSADGPVRPASVEAGPSLASERELRALRAELARTREAADRLVASLGPVRASAASGRSGPERISARLLTPHADGLFVSVGGSSGVEADQPVTEPLALATAGRSDGLSSGDEVLAGAAVVGRIDEVGLWTSTVRPVTDAKFRAHVRLMRDADDSPTFGEDGVLEGDGRSGCRIKYVASTAAVAVGDHVYSRDPSGRIAQPLYYGRVIRADLRDGAPHWEIAVRPAIDPTTLTEVAILKPVEADDDLTVLAN